MKVIPEIGGRWKDDPEAKAFITRCARAVDGAMRRLSETERFKLPGKIVVRPLYYKSNNAGRCYGRAIWDPWKGYYEVALNLLLLRRMDNGGIDTIRHECAHIADAEKHGRWGHSRTHREMCMKAKKK